MVPGLGRIPQMGLDFLTAVVVLNGMGGIPRFELRWDVTLDGEVILATPTSENERSAESDTHTFVNVFQPFPLPRAGNYVVRLTVSADGRSRAFTKVLEIVAAAVPPAAPGAPQPPRLGPAN